jgi:hypothetical protein
MVYKAYKAIRVRRRIAFAVYSVLILLLLWAGFFIGVTPGSRAYADYQMTRDLFGIGFILAHPENEYNSERAFNGDGYTIEVYKLNDSEVNKILSLLSQQAQNLPARPSYRSHWQQTFWRQTPIKREEQQFLEFALMEHVSDTDLEKEHKLLNDLAHEPGHYYSYFYFMHGTYPGDIDFFLLSPSKHLFILVNHNT